MKSLLPTLAVLVALALTALALIDQLVRDPKYRDWHGEVFGVPYDFRSPTRERLRQRLWANDQSRILAPVVFGVGWTINLGCVARLLGLAQSS